MEAEAEADLEALDVEGRPSVDFIDGYLAALAMANSALSDGAPRQRFFSFDWIGDAEEPRDISLRNAFDGAPADLEFDVELLRDWRGEISSLAEKWLAASIRGAGASVIAAEFVELLEAFWGDQAIEAFSVTPTAQAGVAQGDYVLFETSDGRVFLEFSIDA